jgi:hypothetical protein
MAFAQWCVPTLSESQQFEIEKYKRIMHNMAASNPDQLAAVAADLVRQNVQLQVIVQKATKHICELELGIDLAADPRARWRMHPIQSLWRLVVDQVARRVPCRQSPG